MANFDLQEVLFEELGYANNPEIKDAKTRLFGRSIPHVDAVYTVRDFQIAYFSRFEYIDLETIRQLHQAVWSESKTPLLYVILPGEIRIYSGYALPAHTPEQLDDETRLLRHLTQLTDIETTRQKIREQLVQNQYDRIHLETGAFWNSSDGRRINKDTRADYRLLHEMSTLRRKLRQAGLSNELAYLLLGRSILVRYLEDREILDSQTWFPSNHARNYREVLHSINDTYAFFQALSDVLHGDLFPVEKDERDVVTQEHLNLIANFLDGNILETGQLSFWPYNFQYVPIELVSAIYDTFLNTEERKNGGTYYTPHTLVDLVLEETLSPRVTESTMSILDPACGSGVFLVRAFQRLVNAWIIENHGRRPNANQLRTLISDHIFGVDIDASAIRIAIFNLYLAMLDQMNVLEVKTFAFEFPTLKNRNLFEGDFFSEQVQKRLSKRKFDRVIGNPPWVSGLTDAAIAWTKQRNLQIGDRQLAQVFLWAAPEFCKKDGEIALLAPAKGTIFITSGPHASFRKHFFENYHIRAVFNLSALCYELFEDAIHPAVVIFYTPNKPNQDDKFIYITPKPSSLSQQMGTIIAETDDIKYLSPQRVLEFPHIWKIALWGTPRDEALIERLSRFPTLEDVIAEMGLHIAEGIQIGGGDEKPAEWLTNMPIVPAHKIRRYTLNNKDFEVIKERVFHRPRTPSIVQSPLVLVRQSPIDKMCVAAFIDEDVAYTHSVTGIAGKKGQEWLLKWIVTYINSPLAQYYHFMTSTRWAVERGNILHEEYKNMPFYVPADGIQDARIAEITELFDNIVTLKDADEDLRQATYRRKLDNIEIRLAELVFDIFGIYLPEQQLIYDVIKYGIDFFYWGKQKNRRPNGSNAVKPPSSEMLSEYSRAFADAANTLLRYQGESLQSKVYQNGTPLNIVGFGKVKSIGPLKIDVVANPEDFRTVLEQLDKVLLERQSSSLYIRRQVRIYDGSWLYFVKPAERRFWTKSQAWLDADKAISEWFEDETVPFVGDVARG